MLKPAGIRSLRELMIVVAALPDLQDITKEHNL